MYYICVYFADCLQMYIVGFVIICKDYTAFYLKCSINVEGNR